MIPRLLAVAFLLLPLPLAAATADLGVSNTAAYPPLLVDPGERFSLHVNVYTKGPDLADHARLTVTLPAGTTLVAVQSQFGNCSQQGSTVVCDAPGPFGYLTPTPPSDTYSATTSLTLTAPTALEGGIGSIEARVSSDATDPNPANNVWTSTMTTRRFLMVETEADDGPKSLRQTIQTMNSTCGGDLPCKIIFSRDMLIEPLSPLPPITACNSGFDAGGAADAPLRVELRGTRVGSGSGLEIRTSCRSYYPIPGVTIRRLAIDGFPENGIGIITTGDRPPFSSPGVRHVVQECYIGTDNSGKVARPNGFRGIATAAPDALVDIFLNTISGNARSGIAFYSVGSANVLRNRIGLGIDDRPLPNGASGIFAATGDIGLTDNQIAYNRGFGISTLGAHVVNSGNVIRDNGDLPIDIGLNGPSRMGALRPPTLIDAFYDPATNRTTIRGRIAGNNDASPQGGSFFIRFAASDRLNAHGYADAARPLSASAAVFPAVGGDFDREFESVVNGDFRGQLIVGYTAYAAWPDLLSIESSELSDPVVVH